MTKIVKTPTKKPTQAQLKEGYKAWNDKPATKKKTTGKGGK